jgi:hypothetical protein
MQLPITSVFIFHTEVSSQNSLQTKYKYVPLYIINYWLYCISVITFVSKNMDLYIMYRTDVTCTENLVSYVVHTYIRTYVIHTYTHTHIHTYRHTHIYTYTDTHTHTLMLTLMLTLTFTYSHARTHCHTHAHSHVRAHTHTYIIHRYILHFIVFLNMHISTEYKTCQRTQSQYKAVTTKTQRQQSKI